MNYVLLEKHYVLYGNGLSGESVSDEEVVDQKATLEVSCKPKCVRQLKEYQMGIAVESSFSLRIRGMLMCITPKTKKKNAADHQLLSVEAKSSKHLEFHSFQTVHQIFVWTILHPSLVSVSLEVHSSMTRAQKSILFSATLFDEESVASRFLSKTLIVNFDAIKHFACTKRIEGDETGNKHCTGQYFDYWYCIDKCMLFPDFVLCALIPGCFLWENVCLLPIESCDKSKPVFAACSTVFVGFCSHFTRCTSGPSFNLGFTQFESASNKIDIFGFVPGNFDYKEVDFRENRSKYQNDPTIMKKLRDAASDKGKKPAVAISKGKRKEVVKRNPLPKRVKYVIKTVPQHPLRFDISCNRNFAIDVEYFVGGMPHVLNIWIYECCSEVDKDIVYRIGDCILRICNWFVVGTKPKFEKFMNGMFSKVVIDIDGSNRDVEKNEKDGDDLKTSNEQPKDIPKKDDDENVVSAGDHKWDEKSSTESSLQFNFTDPAILRETIEVQNVHKESGTEVKNAAFQNFIDNRIAEISSPVIESTNEISTDAFHESIDNIMAEIFTPVVAMKRKFVSPKETNDSECHIHDSQFPSDLPEADIAGDSLSTQDDYKRSCLVASNEESLINIIKGFNIPAALPWHMVDDRVITEIHKFSVMLPTYLNDSRFMENTQRTVWSSLEAYADKMNQGVGALNQNPFDVEYVEDIAQQISGSLDCEVFVAAYAEFLSDQMQIPSSNVDAEYFRKRYATLL
ncbi:hypothetical protein FXO37_04755 [Capsicum annuum]|nr:hypothetical protein FXO37_04755 [Capsicum annuum]